MEKGKGDIPQFQIFTPHSPLMLYYSPMKVAIQGELGSFHDAAARRFFGVDVEVLTCETFRDVFESVSHENYGLVAIENSLYGSLHDSYNLLLENNLAVTGEVALRIHQQLIGFPGSSQKEITEIYSHSAALDQCRGYLEKNFPRVEISEFYDTAAAVGYIKTHDMRHAAVIASRVAAEQWNMAILDQDIEDETQNITRFFVLAPTLEVVESADKASLVIQTNHTPGALYEALGVFERHNANLTKLESRPVRGEAFRYQFVVDVEIDAATLRKVTKELEAQNCSIRLLGHYKGAA